AFGRKQGDRLALAGAARAVDLHGAEGLALGALRDHAAAGIERGDAHFVDNRGLRRARAAIGLERTLRDHAVARSLDLSAAVAADRHVHVDELDAKALRRRREVAHDDARRDVRARRDAGPRELDAELGRAGRRLLLRRAG